LFADEAAFSIAALLVDTIVVIRIPPRIMRMNL